jgi:hypothetical protein
MTSVLDLITEEHVHSDPFPYLSTTEALEPGYYESLAAQFPDFTDLIRLTGSDEERRWLSQDNVLLHRSGLEAFVDGTPIDPVWRDFMRFQFSNDFYRQVIKHLGEGIRQTYPDLEQRLGKSLEELTVQPRHTEDEGADLWIDIQFSVNTPVLRTSRVRARHVDDPKKLFAGLFYMRAPEDDSIGGNLELCRWPGAPQFKYPYAPGREIDNTHIQDNQADLVNTVKYSANTLIIFINSPFAIHGVTHREPTPHFRRYINIIVECREPLFDLKQYQA